MDMWDNNIWITSLLRNTKVERILNSVDYPLSTNEEGLEFVEEMKQSGMVTEEGLERIAWRNAEESLGAKAR